MSVSETTPEEEGKEGDWNSRATPISLSSGLLDKPEIKQDEGLFLQPPHLGQSAHLPRERAESFVLASFRLIKTDGKL